MKNQRKLLRIQRNDNVAVALRDLKRGESLECGTLVSALEDIPFGHKAALYSIARGEEVIKYGAPIGHASQAIPAGAWVHTHNLITTLSGRIEYAWNPSHHDMPPASDATFEGYIRADDRVGTRNEIWIIPTVGCVNGTASALAREANELYAGRTDGIFAFPHNMGCSQMGEDQERTQRLLAGLVNNPNAGGVLVLGLGCENNHMDAFMPFLGNIDQDRVKFLVAQEVEDEVSSGMALLDVLVRHAEKTNRSTVPLSKLTVGFKCGGSDALSGITANVLCGKANDAVCASGGTTFLTEVPEMFGAETALMSRAESEDIFRSVVCLIDGFKDYYIRNGQSIYGNPSPGNKSGGITTLEEKSLGCIQKGGFAPVVGVLDYGAQPARSGLYLLTGPGNDPISCTNLAASGATVILFTTGRGNPFGAPVPTIKIASNSRLAQHKANWIDFSAGALLEGQRVDELLDTFLSYLLDVASGKIATRNEVNGYREISLFRDGVIL